MRETPTQRASRELAEAVHADRELRAKFAAMVARTRSTEPVYDDLSWVHAERAAMIESSPDERVSLAPADAEDALRALLRTRRGD